MDLTVAVCTYGDRSWQVLAESRAIPSAQHQAPVTRVHGETLHGARNTALERCETPLIVFLDGDDEVEDGYAAAMLTGTADLRSPATRFVTEQQRVRPAQVLRCAGHTHPCTAECISSGYGNWLVIGTCANVELMRAAGGWRDWPCYEDFDLWMRMILLGATVEAIPDAVYKAHVRLDSRNRAPAMVDKNRVHHDIVAANLPALAA